MQEAQLKQLVSDLIHSLGLSGLVEVKTGHRTLVAIASDDSKLLIGPGGEHLQSLNTLAKRIAEQKYGAQAASFLIDVNDYHESKLEGVREEARKHAQKARLFKHDVELPPQSAYERLVVHELFAEDPEIKTESAGEGKFRHIVLKYKDSAFVK